MALEPLELDDLMWTDMMSAIRARIPEASRGSGPCTRRWTGASRCSNCSPGMLEQRGYWLDQAPDPLIRALITLLGQSRARCG